MRRGRKKEIKKEVPILVKIIAILTVVMVIWEILLCLTLISIFSFLLLAIPALFAFIGLIVSSVFFVRELWKGEKWTRIVEIILAGLYGIACVIGLIASMIFLKAINSTILFSNTDFIYPIAGIIISGLIIGYLLLSKKVKEAFS